MYLVRATIMSNAYWVTARVRIRFNCTSGLVSLVQTLLSLFTCTLFFMKLESSKFKFKRTKNPDKGALYKLFTSGYTNELPLCSKDSLISYQITMTQKNRYLINLINEFTASYHL